MTIKVDGKTYEVTKDGIRVGANLIISQSMSMEVDKVYFDQCRAAGIDPHTRRVYRGACANGQKHDVVTMPGVIADEYDKHIAAVLKANMEKEENSVTVYLSSRGWGDYSPVTITIDRRDSTDMWIAAAREALSKHSDVDNPDQTDADLLAKIAAVVGTVEAEKDAEIKELTDLIAGTTGKKLMTEAEAQAWKKNYNNVVNEGGEGYVPVVITVEQVEWAKGRLIELGAKPA